jgi:hypothetical protein
MRIRNLVSVLLTLFVSASVFAQPADTQIQTVADYEDWGWTSIVQQNGLITIATVPVIGARIMQCQLGEYESIFRDPSQYGDTHTPNAWSWYNFGGYKTWPAPQDEWGWPPPPTVDYGEDEADVLIDSPDSTTLFVRSPVEQFKTPDLRFERKSTIYKGNSRVRMDQTLINEGSSQQSWSVWEITQQIVHHPSDDDFENFWAYFPLNPASAFGEDGVFWGSDWGEPSTINFGEVAPGVFGIQYGPEQCKVYGDAPEGWICFADEGEGVIFAKTFELLDDAIYPNNGGMAQVYLSGASAQNISGAYMEVEVAGPMADLAPNGGRTTYTENFWAARVNGPVLDVNTVGIVARALDFDAQTGNVVGRYGVFYVGTAQALVLGSDDGLLAQGALHDVTPLENFSLNEAIDIPEAAGARVAIQIRDYQGNPVGILDEATVEHMSSVESDPSSQPDRIQLARNYPNPFNSRTAIAFRLDRKQSIRLAVYDILGRQQVVLASEILDAGSHTVQWDASHLPGGVYFARIEGESFHQTVKMVYLP